RHTTVVRLRKFALYIERARRPVSPVLRQASECVKTEKPAFVMAVAPSPKKKNLPFPYSKIQINKWAKWSKFLVHFFPGIEAGGAPALLDEADEQWCSVQLVHKFAVAPVNHGC